jgi:hypothetical protein
MRLRDVLRTSWLTQKPTITLSPSILCACPTVSSQSKGCPEGGTLVELIPTSCSTLSIGSRPSASSLSATGQDYGQVFYWQCMAIIPTQASEVGWTSGHQWKEWLTMSQGNASLSWKQNIHCHHHFNVHSSEWKYIPVSRHIRYSILASFTGFTSSSEPSSSRSPEHRKHPYQLPGSKRLFS